MRFNSLEADELALGGYTVLFSRALGIVLFVYLP
jgi:hypothetical protein